jgi:glycosyltransferase involved in cell wall biosynthesis
MRLVIVADWLVTFGGAEHVLAEIAELYPDAPIVTTVARRGKLGPLKGRDIRTSWLQRWYERTGNHQVLLPWMPRAVEDCDLSGFDVILSSSHAVAKGIIPPAGAVHVCYCHTPARYAWEMEDDYLKDFRVPRIVQPAVRRQLKRLRRWDMTTAKRVDVFLANSTTTQERIRRIYARESTVLHPPVSDRFFSVRRSASPEGYFLAVGRMVPYKRFDLLIEAANREGWPLWLAGDGQDSARLRRLAGPSVRFLGHVPEDELPQLYADAEALLFPQVEDAGIVLREALACGTPCIALRSGGALDAVEDGVNGIFFDQQSVDALAAAIRDMQKRSWNRDAIRESVRQCSVQAFREQMTGAIENAYRARCSGIVV